MKNNLLNYIRLMTFNKLIKEIVDTCICEAKKDKNRKKIEEDVLAPLIDYILEKIKPYVIGTSIFFITLILLIISILYLILISGIPRKISQVPLQNVVKL